MIHIYLQNIELFNSCKLAYDLELLIMSEFYRLICLLLSKILLQSFCKTVSSFPNHEKIQKQKHTKHRIRKPVHVQSKNILRRCSLLSETCARFFLSITIVWGKAGANILSRGSSVVEQGPEKPCVGSSILLPGTTIIEW